MSAVNHMPNSVLEATVNNSGDTEWDLYKCSLSGVLIAMYIRYHVQVKNYMCSYSHWPIQKDMGQKNCITRIYPFKQVFVYCACINGPALEVMVVWSIGQSERNAQVCFVVSGHL